LYANLLMTLFYGDREEFVLNFWSCGAFHSDQSPWTSRIPLGSIRPPKRPLNRVLDHCCVSVLQQFREFSNVYIFSLNCKGSRMELFRWVMYCQLLKIIIWAWIEKVIGLHATNNIWDVFSSSTTYFVKSFSVVLW
jgi:hypothetical protein